MNKLASLVGEMGTFMRHDPVFVKRECWQSITQIEEKISGLEAKGDKRTIEEEKRLSRL